MEQHRRAEGPQLHCEVVRKKCVIHAGECNAVGGCYEQRVSQAWSYGREAAECDEQCAKQTAQKCDDEACEDKGVCIQIRQQSRESK